MALRIVTNNHTRPLIPFYLLDEKQQAYARKEFDWDKNIEDSSFFIYKGRMYHSEEFVMSKEIPGWDAYSNDSFFSGVVVKYAIDEYGAQMEDNSGCSLFIFGYFIAESDYKE